MIYDIFQILLWVTAIMLAISGIDDLYMDMLYWIFRGKYKAKMPDFKDMFDKPEKPVAIILGAWNEASVIGRTLSYAVRNLKYTNYRIFVGAYPNDPETIRIVKELSRKDPRIICCINPQKGPTTKADNLNSLYAGLSEYEKVYGEFEVIIVHDAEDFIHPYSMKLYNYLIGYKGYHGVQIPVVPIKSKLGKLFHRTYCDAFAEVHTKDMIVRESMDTFVPFSGTGMGFHRKAIYYLEKNNGEREGKEIHTDAVLTNAYFKNDEEARVDDEVFVNETSYKDDPFEGLNDKPYLPNKETPLGIKQYTTAFLSIMFVFVGFLVYTGITEKYEDGNSQFANSDRNTGSFIGSVGRKFFPEGLIAAEKIAKIQTVPEGVEKSSTSFKDNKYEAYYLIRDDDKISIQESIWNSEMQAKERLLSILASDNTNSFGFISKENNNNNEVSYKVIVGAFETLDDARDFLKNFREGKSY